jgi:undecaprenyl diphosphate synthase
MKQIDKARLPVHIAIIMDGNGRWAEKKGLSRIEGHIAGVNCVREIVRSCSELGIGVLTLYAFSTENWARSELEVKALMRLLRKYLREEIEDLNRNHVRLKAIGKLEGLPRPVLKELENCMKITSGNDGLILNLALNYGGRADIVDGVRKLASDVKDGKLELKDINEEVFSQYLYTSGLPDPELLIRTSGEMRVSNFLLWQISYAEIWVTPVCWPDFGRAHLLQAIVDYQKRERRFGRI